MIEEQSIIYVFSCENTSLVPSERQVVVLSPITPLGNRRYKQYAICFDREHLYCAYSVVEVLYTSNDLRAFECTELARLLTPKEVSGLYQFYSKDPAGVDVVRSLVNSHNRCINESYE